MKRNELITKNTLDYKKSFITIVNAWEAKIKSIGNTKKYTVNPSDPTSASRTTAKVILNDFEEGSIVYSIELTEIYSSEVKVYRIFPKFIQEDFSIKLDLDSIEKNPELKYHFYIEMDAYVKRKGIWSNDGIAIQDRSGRNISAKEHLDFLINILILAKTVSEYESDNFIDPMGCLADYE